MSKVNLVVISLFDGISVARHALNQLADVNVLRYYSSEVDKYAISIANKNHPGDKPYRLGDVTKVDFNIINNDIERLRLYEPNLKVLLIGGSPCQGFTRIGLKGGLNTLDGKGIHSYLQYQVSKLAHIELKGVSWLFWEYVRAFKELKHAYYMLENVVMLNKYKAVIDGVLGVENMLINSNLVSAQSRPRLYWFNWSVAQPVDKGIELNDILDPLEPFREISPSFYKHRNGSKHPRIHKMKVLGVAKKSSCLTTSTTHTEGYYLNEDKTKMRNMSVLECEQLQTLPIGYTDVNGSIIDTQRFRCLGNSFTSSVIQHILKGIK